MNKFEYAIPESLADSFEYLETPEAVAKAGGIDLLDLMKEGLATPKRVVNLRHLKELHFVTKRSDGGLSIGPNNTLAELAEHPEVRSNYRALAQAADSAATPQIRNAATLGGNLCQRPRCWYFRSEDFHCLRNGGDVCFAVDGMNQYHAIFCNGDGCVIVHPSATAVALMALNARLKLATAESERELPIDSFFVTPAQNMMRENVLRPGELITEIVLPPPPGGFTSFYYKQKEKQAFDWPIAEVAVGLTLEGKRCTDARVVLGAAAPIPWRLEKTEALLRNQVITPDLTRKAAGEALQDATPLSLNGYKVPVFEAVLYRALCWAAGIDPFA